MSWQRAKLPGIERKQTVNGDAYKDMVTACEVHIGKSVTFPPGTRCTDIQDAINLVVEHASSLEERITEYKRAEIEANPDRMEAEKRIIASLKPLDITS